MTVYAARGIFQPRGTDTIPAMLTPGEIVLTREVSRQILAGQAAIVPGHSPEGRSQGAKSILGGRLSVVGAAMGSMAMVGRGAATVPQHLASGGIAGAIFAASGAEIPEVSAPTILSQRGPQRSVTPPESALDRVTAARAEALTRRVHIEFNVQTLDSKSFDGYALDHVKAIKNALDYEDSRG